MELRNKKTGGRYTLGEDIHIAHTGNGSIEVEIVLGSGGFAREYFDSLAEFNDEWEDYKPTEPLIKDEKIRKVVRAWAEALDLRWFKRCVSVSPHTSRLYGQDARGIGYTIELKPSELYGDLIDKKGYTLAELCGEEEEC